jgi:hypothetical protein
MGPARSNGWATQNFDGSREDGSTCLRRIVPLAPGLSQGAPDPRQRYEASVTDAFSQARDGVMSIPSVSNPGKMISLNVSTNTRRRLE